MHAPPTPLSHTLSAKTPFLCMRSSSAAFSLLSRRTVRVSFKVSTNVCMQRWDSPPDQQCHVIILRLLNYKELNDYMALNSPHSQLSEDFQRAYAEWLSIRRAHPARPLMRGITCNQLTERRIYNHMHRQMKTKVADISSAHTKITSRAS